MKLAGAVSPTGRQSRNGWHSMLWRREVLHGLRNLRGHQVMSVAQLAMGLQWCPSALCAERVSPADCGVQGKGYWPRVVGE